MLWYLVLRELVIISTAITLFQLVHGNLQVKTEKVSVGSFLGPTFAIFLRNLKKSISVEPSLK